MKTKSSRFFKCFKCFVVFYLVLISVSGLAVTVFANYLFIFRQERHISKPRIIVLSFLIVPPLLTLLATILGWASIKKKNIRLLKCFAVVLALTDILQIIGCLWCFISLPQINEQVSSYMEEKFSIIGTDSFSETWWNNIQVKLKCCGLHGPTDYSAAKGVPFSCCGSDPNDETKGSCSFLWQKGCISSLTKEMTQDVLFLGLIGLGVAFIQVPGVFISWCFARKMSKEIL